MATAVAEPVAPALDREVESKRLKAAVEGALRWTMGVPVPAAGDVAPLTSAIVWVVLYIILWVGFALIINPSVPSDPRLDSLLAWGGLYCATALYLAQSATVRIKDTVAKDIAPHASAAYMAAVSDDLNLHYSRAKLALVSLLMAVIALAFALWTLIADQVIALPLSLQRLSGELVFWIITYGIHFFCAAIAVIAAGFYSCFTAHLDKEKDGFYVLGAAETPIIRGIERLSMEVLTFWGAIFLIVLSSMLLAIVPPEPYFLKRDSVFLFTLIPIAGFFSLGVGTLVHLSTDAKVRAVLHRFTYKHAAALQAKSRRAFDPANRHVPSTMSEVEKLSAWHDRIIAGGRYGSRTGTSVSIALPLILPVVGLLVEIFG